ncbi:MAG: Xaa-Pro dipeptidase, partial [Candidatus Marinimicrobia bacterium]|nr:Xaa-Pro dipeptidase [Candidatus Neomarinimicrobiota bacterium]
MDYSIYTKRQNNLKSVLEENNLDGIFITNLTNIRYICGFTGSAASCLVTPEGQYFLSDGRYIEQSKEQVKGFKCFLDMSSHLEQIKNEKLKNPGLKIAFEGQHVSYSLYRQMKNLFPKT